MQIQDKSSIEDLLNKIPKERLPYFKKLHELILNHLPKGFEAAISYGMLSYVVPHNIYPSGYHCKPSEPLPFASIASQKNSINLYHMGLYANPDLMQWFLEEYPKHSRLKPDIGKSCIRFKKMEEIPHELIGELFTKISVEEWIATYESLWKK